MLPRLSRLLALFSALACAGPAIAEEWTVVSPGGPGDRYEAWAGADAMPHSWSVYGGVTTSLWGDLRDPGLRLRSAAAYGVYSYTSPRWNGVARVPVKFDGEQHYTDVLLGYHAMIGPWIVKVFAGATQAEHTLRPFDTENGVQGERIGFKGALESWLAIGQVAFVQSEINWSSVFETYGARLRAGYRLSEAISAGLEGAANGNANYDAGRLGVFGRLEWKGGEFSASGGVGADRSGTAMPYGSVGVLFRF